MSTLKMTSEKQCDIVIVNWNSGEQLADCLHSLGFIDDEAICKVVVVDNGSADDSHRRAGIAEKLTVIEAGENLGFAKACNLGRQEGSSDYLLFLNPDTRVDQGSIGQTIAFMESVAANDIGICGIRLFDNKGAEQRHCARFPTAKGFAGQSLGLDRIFPTLFPRLHMTEFDHCEGRRVDHVIGAFYMIRRSLFDALGGFDEDFFLYYEDLDLSFRAKQSGQFAYYLASASAFHKGGGTSDQIKAKRLAYSLRSKLFYSRKHHGTIGYAVVWIATMVAEPIARLIQLAVQKRTGEIADLRKGYRLLWSKPE